MDNGSFLPPTDEGTNSPSLSFDDLTLGPDKDPNSYTAFSDPNSNPSSGYEINSGHLRNTASTPATSANTNMNHSPPSSSTLDSFRSPRGTLHYYPKTNTNAGGGGMGSGLSGSPHESGKLTSETVDVHAVVQKARLLPDKHDPTSSADKRHSLFAQEKEKSGKGTPGEASPKEDREREDDYSFQLDEEQPSINGVGSSASGFSRGGGGSLTELTQINKRKTEKRISDAMIPPSRRPEYLAQQQKKAPKKPFALSLASAAHMPAAAGALSPRGTLARKKMLAKDKESSGSLALDMDDSPEPKSQGGEGTPSSFASKSLSKPPLSPRHGSGGGLDSIPLSKKEERNFISKVLQL
eukprot:CAMPEP_0184699254 /NCGR_PEP_ID=MMETSP0313-20130426/5592_1 /TAXON_ID=2792 /ORGANISM="Porphyridium aerugineum, Strain SAG 1380-2" /LENGTH=352 /DNA_ID=CAMNT_0027158319 /DNA_START=119 /DNA_END=1177 /DNA_ORIENTATION=+